MNLLKGVSGAFRRGLTGGIEATQGAFSETSKKFIASWPEIEFSAEEEQRLISAWETYDGAKGQDQMLAFNSFLLTFIQNFEDWKPDDILPELAIGSSEQSSPQKGFSDQASAANPSPIIQGCSGGHPRKVVAGLIYELKIAVSRMQVQSYQRKDPMDLFHTEVDLNLLHALTIVSRSIYNQRIFNLTGGFDVVICLMEGAVIRLRVVLEFLRGDEGRGAMSNHTELSFLLCQMAHIMSVLENLVNVSLRKHKAQSKQHTSSELWSGKQGTLPAPEDIFIAKTGNLALSQGKRAREIERTNLMFEAVQAVPLAKTGGIVLNIELLRLLRQGHLDGVIPDRALEQMTLRTLKVAIMADSSLQEAFCREMGLEAILPILQWPDQLMPGKWTSESEMTQQLKEFHHQLLALQLIREVLFRNVPCIEKFADLGGFSALSELVFWASISFGADLNGRNPSSSGADYQDKLQVPGLRNDKAAELFCHNPQLGEICTLLTSFINLKSMEEVARADVARAEDTEADYWQLAVTHFISLFRGVFLERPQARVNDKQALRQKAPVLQRYVVQVLWGILSSSPLALTVFRACHLWDLLLTDHFFRFGHIALPHVKSDMDMTLAQEDEATLASSPGGKGSSQMMVLAPSPTQAAVVEEADAQDGDSPDAEELRLQITRLIESAATLSETESNLVECDALLEALQKFALVPSIAVTVARSLHHVLQLAPATSMVSLLQLEAGLVLAAAIARQQQAYRKQWNDTHKSNESNSGRKEKWWQARLAVLSLFEGYVYSSGEASSAAIVSWEPVNVLFSLLWEQRTRSFAIRGMVNLMIGRSMAGKDPSSRSNVFVRYLEALPQVKVECRNDRISVLADMLAGIRDVLATNSEALRRAFVDGGCFIQIVSLLNEEYSEEAGVQLCLHVLTTLAALLAGSQDAKMELRHLVGPGYHMLSTLLIQRYHRKPNNGLLLGLLDLIFEGNLDGPGERLIENEDAVMLFFYILRQCDEDLQTEGLDKFERLLANSTSNCVTCATAGLVGLLLDWLTTDAKDILQSWILRLLYLSGSHNISGKDMSTILSLLRSTKEGCRPRHWTLLLRTLQSMVKEDGPAVFFELDGLQSGIVIRHSFQLPSFRGYAFCCWFRVEKFKPGSSDDPYKAGMGLFSFFTDFGKGCSAILSEKQLLIHMASSKETTTSVPFSFHSRRWYHLAISHSLPGIAGGGGMLDIFVDGNLISSAKKGYPKVYDPLTKCSIAGRARLPPKEGASAEELLKADHSLPFHGQLGAVYIFDDALTAQQVEGVYSLGPGYMFSFSPSEVRLSTQSTLVPCVFDGRDGLSTRLLASYNAQAHSGPTVFDTSPKLDSSNELCVFDAEAVGGVKLCSRQRVQDTIHCIGGIRVLFPLFLQLDQAMEGAETHDHHKSKGFEPHAVDVIGLFTALLGGNNSNQQHMLSISGFAIIGHLLQSVSIDHLGVKFVLALENLVGTMTHASDASVADALVKGVLSYLYLDPSIWIKTPFKVQRELYTSLASHVERAPASLRKVVSIVAVLDILRQYYGESPPALGSTPQRLAPAAHEDYKKFANGRVLERQEVAKLRLLLLGVAERALSGKGLTLGEVKVLLCTLEISQDIALLEDLLHFVLKLLARKAAFLALADHISEVGGCHLLLSLLTRQQESVRLLGLRLIGALAIAVSNSKRGEKAPDKGRTAVGPVFSAVEQALAVFPVTQALRVALFDVLVGRIVAKQEPSGVKSKAWISAIMERSSAGSSPPTFAVPQTLHIIFKALQVCAAPMRRDVLKDLVTLLELNSKNKLILAEESQWQCCLFQLLSDSSGGGHGEGEHDGEGTSAEQHEGRLLRQLFQAVHVNSICTVKGGWRHLDQTLNVLQLFSERGVLSGFELSVDILADTVVGVLKQCSTQAALTAQPCRDNCLYLLSLIDEVVIVDKDKSPPTSSPRQPPSVPPADSSLLSGGYVEVERGELSEPHGSSSRRQSMSEAVRGWQSRTTSEEMGHAAGSPQEQHWCLYDALWALLGAMNGKGQAMEATSSLDAAPAAATPAPTFGQRARGLMESLSGPAAEMAAAMVTGGMSQGAAGSRGSDKVLRLRGEKCPRVVFRLVLLYLHKAELQRASHCAQQFGQLLPSFLSLDNDLLRSRVHYFLWSLLDTRMQVGSFDSGARFHVVSQIIRETVEHSKGLLASSMGDRRSHSFDISSVYSLLQQDRITAAINDDKKYVEITLAKRAEDTENLRSELDAASQQEAKQEQAISEHRVVTMSSLCVAEIARQSAAQVARVEERQATARWWRHIYRDLTGERGPWSGGEAPLVRWKLDKVEDSLRRRQRLRPNYRFNHQLLTQSNAAQPSQGGKGDGAVAGTMVSDTAEGVTQYLLKGLRGLTHGGASEPQEEEESSPRESEAGKDSKSVERSSSISVSEPGTPRSEDGDGPRSTDSAAEGEAAAVEVLMSRRSVLVTSKRKLVGLLEATESHLHFHTEYVDEGTAGSSVFQSSSEKKPFSSSRSMKLGGESLDRKSSSAGPGDEKSFLAMRGEGSAKSLDLTQDVKEHRNWPLAQLKEVHMRRYLLRHTALELFFLQPSMPPVFLNLHSSHEAKATATKICALANIERERCQLVDKRRTMERLERARALWSKREMSNFEYLMELNTLAGRTYNDLTQYPVFPWILVDYKSSSLDLSDESVFRDLSKPVGALNESRFKKFEERYRGFSDPDIPSFFYGSHYSTAGVVLFFLVRLEPFSTLNMSLQGGKFDHADRLFTSIESTFANCLTNSSDVKELVPEFFYSSEFLVNSNKYHLGHTQDGELLDDVVLPPWAEGSPEKFIRLNREALESEYVSQQLHEWIDLIFGFKQRGASAIEAANVFFHLTYEGAVDLDAIDDPFERSSVEDQIANFGQTPVQLFRKPHLVRGPPVPVARPLFYAPASITLTSKLPPSQPSLVNSARARTGGHPAALVFVALQDGRAVTMTRSQVAIVRPWITPYTQAGNSFTFSQAQDPFFGFGDSVTVRRMSTPFTSHAEVNSGCFALLRGGGGALYILSCGHWDNSFLCSSISEGRILSIVRQHHDVVTCLSVSTDGLVLVTGSRDTTIMVWDIRLPPGTASRSLSYVERQKLQDNVIFDKPRSILCGHTDAVSCVVVQRDLDIVASGSMDATCILHTLGTGRYLRTMRHPSGGAVDKLVLGPQGVLVMHSHSDFKLHACSINGKWLASSDSNGRLSSMCISTCGEFLITGGETGLVTVRRMHSLEVVRHYEGTGSPITSLAITPEECILVGLQEGSLLVFSIEPQQLKKSMAHFSLHTPARS